LNDRAIQSTVTYAEGRLGDSMFFFPLSELPYFSSIEGVTHVAGWRAVGQEGVFVRFLIDDMMWCC